MTSSNSMLTLCSSTKILNRFLVKLLCVFSFSSEVNVFAQQEYWYENIIGEQQVYSSLAEAEAAMRADHGLAGSYLTLKDSTSNSARPSVNDIEVFTYRYGVPEQPVIEYEGLPGWRIYTGDPRVDPYDPLNATFASQAEALDTAISMFCKCMYGPPQPACSSASAMTTNLFHFGPLLVQLNFGAVGFR